MCDNLTVGGITETVLAANRNGLCMVILPKRNEFDLEDVPANVRSEMNFIFAERVDDVVNAALMPAAAHENGAEPELMEV